MAAHIPKTVRNIFWTIVIMLFIFLVGGVIYVFVVDRSVNVPAKTTQTTSTEPSVLKPVPPADNAPEGVASEAFTSPVKAGDNASITVRTNAGSSCTILVTYNNVPSKDSGLAPKTADVYGFAIWSWTVESSVPAGTWPVKVTCVYHGRTGLVIDNLVVTKS